MTPRILHGKGGVDGSSPSEGFGLLPAQGAIALSLAAMAGVRSVHRTSTNVHRFGEKHFLNGCDRHIAFTADVEHDLPVARANRPVGERAALTFERRKLAQLLLDPRCPRGRSAAGAVARDDVDAGTSAERIPAESALRERLLPQRTCDDLPAALVLHSHLDQP